MGTSNYSNEYFGHIPLEMYSNMVSLDPFLFIQWPLRSIFIVTPDKRPVDQQYLRAFQLRFRVKDRYLLLHRTKDLSISNIYALSN